MPTCCSATSTRPTSLAAARRWTARPRNGFGGAAGLHAVDVARELEFSRVIVPTVASVLSAWGMLASDLRYEIGQTHVGDGARLDGARLAAVFAQLERDAERRLREWFSGPVRIERSAEMRYGEQVFEIDVMLGHIDWDAPDLLSVVEQRFHARHEELYTYASRDQEVVFVNARVAAIGSVASLTHRAGDIPLADGAGLSGRSAYFAGWRRVPVQQIARLAPRTTIVGPAILESETTTVILGPGDRVSMNDLGWLDIDVALRPA